MTENHKFEALIFQSAKRTFQCRRPAGGELFEAVALAVLLKEDHIVVGDRVEVEEKAPGEFQIVRVIPRKNQITRFIPRENKVKVTAANCDILAIVMSVSKPEYKRGLVDRYLIRAAEWGLKPFLIFNKMDEHEEGNPDLVFESQRLEKIGVECFEIAARQVDYVPRILSQGLSQLKEAIKGKSAIFVGQSGVGKSKTISALSGGKVELLTGELAKGAGKGAHTTTWAQMIDCRDFLLIDSPGIRSFSMEDVFEEDLMCYFPDLGEVARFCKFTTCGHNPHDKGCAFYSSKVEQKDQAAVLSRLESYKKILEEVGEIPSWKKKKS